MASKEIFVVINEWHKEVKVNPIQLLLSDMVKEKHSEKKPADETHTE